ncbi:glycoside hydrolase family 16 protein [Chitinophaga sp. MM2321]|uniref:glycoside hydrolase family 16 protein n=1 Tax=Chitinophaga sp. MM2321 TaxID=3137178 RepID=UPI0032D5B0EE
MIKKLNGLCLATITAGLLASSCSQPAKVQASGGGSGEFKTLVWSDEFDRDGLPDSTKWSYQEGFVRNNEEQYYTTARTENARVAGGHLIIEGRKEKFANAFHQPGSNEWQFHPDSASYTSACIVTQGKASWTYGRIEVRAKLPRGMGVWPAIWTLGDNEPVIGWPRCGEIDIMEFVGHDSARVHGNAHYEDPQKKKHTSMMGTKSEVSPTDGFHIYAIEWKDDRIDFYYDEHRFHTFPLDNAGVGKENAFRKPHFLLLNLALGGAWGGKIDDAIFPQSYILDYVRVFQ